VAPKSPTIDVFRENLSSADTWLTPFNGFGPDNFLVGQPDFDFGAYQAWIGERFAPRHFQRFVDKMDYPSLYAAGPFIQSLGQNPGLEGVLQELGAQTHVYLGTGLGNLHTIYDASVAHHESQQRWTAFWAGRDAELDEYLAELARIDSTPIEGDI